MVHDEIKLVSPLLSADAAGVALSFNIHFLDVLTSERNFRRQRANSITDLAVRNRHSQRYVNVCVLGSPVRHCVKTSTDNVCQSSHFCDMAAIMGCVFHKSRKNSRFCLTCPCP